MADTKNYGLVGVGSNVQLGKAGPRWKVDTGKIQARNTADAALINVEVADPVADTDAATKLYVDNIAAGLDPKESCRLATTAALSGATYGPSGGAGGNGQFTSAPTTIDGQAIATGDRILVKNQATATQNGIYVVTGTTSTWDRADDHNSNAEVSAGNFTFIEEGSTNADSGWVLQGPDPLTINTSNLNWVLFSTSSDIVAGTGLVKTGNVLDLDFSELTSASTIATADELIFSDAGVESRITVANFLADRDIVTATSSGIITRTGEDTYASRTITASAVAGEEGITITNGNGVSGNPTIGVDIVGQTNLATDDVDDADELLIHHSVAGGTEAVGNYAITALKLKNYMNAGTSTSSITAGDSTLQVTDAGTGQMEFNIDGGSQQVLITAATSTFNNDVNISTGNTLTVVDLTNNDVLIAGTGGLVEDSGGALTFDGSTLALTGDATISQSVYLTQQSAAGADTADDGQIWVQDDTPNTLMFTDDAGNDFTVNNVLEIEYIYSSAVTSTDPGAGTLNFNTVTIGSIATLYIDDLDATGRDNSFLLANLAIGDLLTFRSASDPADYLVVSVTSVTDSTGFWTIGVSPVHTGTIFTNNDKIRLGVEWQSQGSTSNILVTDESADTVTYPVFVNDATGSQAPKTDASAYTYNASTGQLAATSFIASSLTENDVLVAGASGLIEDSAGNFTWSGTVLALTGAMDITGDLDVDNVNINGNTISITDTNGNLTIQPNGTGQITLANGSGEEVLEIQDTASAVNGLAIVAGASGNPAQITTGTGSQANIDIGFLTNGTGVLSVTAGSGNYEDNVTADDDIPNKKYVDDAIAATGGSGTVDTITGTISLSGATTQNIGAATGIPANCTIMSVTLDVTVASDAATTVTIGDSTNGLASYMAATENDPEVTGIYIADGRVANGGAARQAVATLTSVGSTGSATVIITFRHN